MMGSDQTQTRRWLKLSDIKKRKKHVAALRKSESNILHVNHFPAKFVSIFIQSQSGYC